MRITYRLSNRQRKELLVRGTEIRVALPVPLTDESDWLAWSQSVLPDDVSELVVAAKETKLWVGAIRTGEGENLQGHLGRIVDPPRLPKPIFLQCVVAVVVTLRPARVRHVSDKIAWPDSVDFFGEYLP